MSAGVNPDSRQGGTGRFGGIGRGGVAKGQRSRQAHLIMIYRPQSDQVEKGHSKGQCFRYGDR